MAIYNIPEPNLPKLEKKLAMIQKKCMQVGCYFKYERAGEPWLKNVTVEDPKGVEEPWHATVKMIPIDVEGEALINGFEFIAALEKREGGNFVSAAPDKEVPERFFDCELECEHCHTKHQRGKTFIVRNIETGEYKQVGRSCLKLYTGGFDAEFAASWAEFLELMTTYETGDWISSFSRGLSVYETKAVVSLAVQFVKQHGYVKVPLNVEDPNNPSTLKRVEVAYEKGNKGDNELAEKILSWLADQPNNSSYIHNLKLLTSQEAIEDKDMKFVVSIGIAYTRDIDKKAEWAKKNAEEAAQRAASEYVGEVGDKIEVEVESWKVMTTWSNAYTGGTTYLYKFTGKDGNCYTWATERDLDGEEVIKLTGTVKDHKTFRDEKQTVLTRCKVEVKKAELPVVGGLKERVGFYVADMKKEGQDGYVVHYTFTSREGYTFKNSRSYEVKKKFNYVEGTITRIEEDGTMILDWCEFENRKIEEATIMTLEYID